MFDRAIDEVHEKGILCFLGFHGEWVTDQAADFTVRRCGFCNEPDDQNAARRVQVARLFSQFPPAGMSTLDERAWISEQTLQECTVSRSRSTLAYTHYRRYGV